MCKYSSDKEMNKLIKKLVATGWKYERLKKHGCLITPCGRWRMTVSGSPGSGNAAKHLKWDIQKYSKLFKFSGKELK